MRLLFWTIFKTILLMHTPRGASGTEPCLEELCVLPPAPHSLLGQKGGCRARASLGEAARKASHSVSENSSVGDTGASLSRGLRLRSGGGGGGGECTPGELPDVLK